MTPEDQEALAQCARTMAEILHRNSPRENIQTLEGIELTVRNQLIKYVSPEIVLFLLKPKQDSSKEEPERS